MPNVRLPVRKIKEILRLKYGTGLSKRKIALCCNVSHSTVSGCLVRAAKAEIGWPLSEGLDDRRLEELLYPAPVRRVSEPATPDWAVVHTELKRKGVTLQLLWEEYQERHADGWQYSWFCEHYLEYSKKLNPSMRQVHKAGEKLFVDYAGQTIPVVDRGTGEIHPAQIFVGVLGASSYTYAEATWTQSLEDWIGSHVRAFEFYGGVTELVIPDYVPRNIIRIG